MNTRLCRFGLPVFGLLISGCAETQINQAPVIDRSGRNVPPVVTITAPAAVKPAPLTAAAVPKPAVASAPAGASESASAALSGAAPEAAVGTVAPLRSIDAHELAPIAAPSLQAAPASGSTPTPASAPTPALAAGAADVPGAGEGATAAGAFWLWPARGRVAGHFDGKGSRGIEIAVEEDAPVVAVADGEVTYKGSPREYGNLVIVRHPDELLSVYAFTKQVLVEQGQKVARGERIAVAGSTPGRGPLLHFEVRRKGTAIDPLTVLAQP
jgi:lipoprotein NlpD